MFGTINFTFEEVEDGMTTHCKSSLKNVNIADKLSAFQSMEQALKMDDADFFLYVMMRKKIKGSGVTDKHDSIDMSLLGSLLAGIGGDDKDG